MSVDIPGSVAVSTTAPCGISTGLLPLPFPIVWRFAFHSIADDLSMALSLLQTLLVLQIFCTQTLRARVTQFGKTRIRDFFAGGIRPPQKWLLDTETETA